MSFDRLTKFANKLGYTHLSLEFCMEMQPIVQDFNRFMGGMRELLAPVDTEEYADRVQEMSDIPQLIDIDDERRKHEDLYPAGKLKLVPENEPEGQGNGWYECHPSKATAWAVWDEDGEDGERLFSGSRADAEKFMLENSIGYPPGELEILGHPDAWGVHTRDGEEVFPGPLSWERACQLVDDFTGV